MEKIFLKVLNMSATASIVILAVLLIRLLLRKAPKKYSYGLWAVVGFRLCCPVSISSALSLLNFMPSAPSKAAGRGTAMQFIPDDIALAPQPRVELITPRLSEAINHSLPAATPQASANPMQIWLFVGVVLWCVGMAALLVYSIVSVWRLYRRVATATRLDGNVWQSENVSSPFILGVFAPRIYLPYGLGEQEREYVLAHEKYHLKRRDYLVKLFAFALLTVHWFNPLCYLAFFLMTRDMEMSCDEAVLSKSDGIKTAYSTTLLSFAANRRFPSAIPLAFGESGVGSRIKNVLSWKAPKRYVAPVAFLLCAAIVLACSMNPRQTLGEVCGEFWESDVACSYTEENVIAPNTQYPVEPLRLCDHLSGVKIGAAHAEKTVAIAPEWSTLYLALPSADGTEARHLTIDFVREHDPLDGPEPVYSLNIGTRDDTRSYEVLSGQEQINAFLAYLRGEMLAQNVFPLSEEKVSDALGKSGLSGSISPSESTSYGQGHMVYVVRSEAETYSSDPGAGKVMVATVSSMIDDSGRRLQTMFERLNVSDPFVWEDWKKQLVFSALLYGGFGDEEEIYRALAAEEVPKSTNFEGTIQAKWFLDLSGGYCRITYSTHRGATIYNEYGVPSRGYDGILGVHIYESKAAYEALQLS